MVQRTAKENRYWAERNALEKTEIKTAEQIAKLPWHGNHASDMGLFTACERFIKSEAKAGKRDSAKQALFLMGKHGMGITSQITEKEFQEYLDCE